MMTGETVARIIRERGEQIRLVADQTIATPPADGIAVVGLTVDNGNYPLVAGAVYLLQIQSINVEDDEGSTATYSADEGYVPALNLGTAIPPVGTFLIAHSVSGHWVFGFSCP